MSDSPVRDDFTSPLAEKLALLDQFLDLTRQQSDILSQEDTAGLLRNIEERQTIIDRLESLQADMDRQADADENAGGIEAKIQARLREILDIDGRNRQAAEALSGSIKAEIRKTSDNRKTLQKYSQNSEAFSSEFFDKRQ